MSKKMQRLSGWIILAIIFGVFSITILGLKIVLMGLAGLFLIGLIVWALELTQTPD